MITRSRYLPIPDSPVQLRRYISWETFEHYQKNHFLLFSMPYYYKDFYEALPGHNDDIFLTLMADKSTHRDGYERDLTTKFHRTIQSALVAQYVNCWTLEQTDSNAMWSVFIPNGKGVIIESTSDKIISWLDSLYSEFIPGKVSYERPKRDGRPESPSIFSETKLLSYKRSYFYYEKEFRFILSKLDQRDLEAGHIQKTNRGYFVKIPPKLLDKVVTYPNAGDTDQANINLWHEESTGIDSQIARSSILDKEISWQGLKALNSLDSNYLPSRPVKSEDIWFSGWRDLQPETIKKNSSTQLFGLFLIGWCFYNGPTSPRLLDGNIVYIGDSTHKSLAHSLLEIQSAIKKNDTSHGFVSKLVQLRKKFKLVPQTDYFYYSIAPCSKNMNSIQTENAIKTAKNTYLRAFEQKHHRRPIFQI